MQFKVEQGPGYICGVYIETDSNGETVKIENMTLQHNEIVEKKKRKAPRKEIFQKTFVYLQKETKTTNILPMFREIKKYVFFYE